MCASVQIECLQHEYDLQTTTTTMTTRNSICNRNFQSALIAQPKHFANWGTTAWARSRVSSWVAACSSWRLRLLNIRANKLLHLLSANVNLLLPNDVCQKQRQRLRQQQMQFECVRECIHECVLFVHVLTLFLSTSTAFARCPCFCLPSAIQQLQLNLHWQRANDTGCGVSVSD